MNKSIYLEDNCRSKDRFIINNPQRIDSKIEFYNEDGEMIWEPLHNKTVIAGAALTLQKLFGLDSTVLNATPTYDEILELDDASSSPYPTVGITDGNGNVIGSIQDETQRTILGFCVGDGGSGLEASDVFEVNYASWITPPTYNTDSKYSAYQNVVGHIIPFRYPLSNSDDVDERIYKGRKSINNLSDGQVRNAYYFKEFTNTPNLVQNYVSTIGTNTNSISAEDVYTSAYADRAQSFVELHLKITQEDCREYFITHSGLESAKINQISLVYGWKKKISRTKLNSSGNIVTEDYEVYQQVRPFSVCNIPTELLAERDKSISIIYTLYA